MCYSVISAMSLIRKQYTDNQAIESPANDSSNVQFHRAMICIKMPRKFYLLSGRIILVYRLLYTLHLGITRINSVSSLGLQFILNFNQFTI